MSNFIQSIYDRYVKQYSQFILIAGLCIFFMAVAYYFLWKYYINPNASRKFKDVPNIAENDHTIRITMFHVDWCPYCKTAIPEYDSFKQKYDGQIVNGYRLIVDDKDCTNENDRVTKELVTKYHIESYPTVKALKPDPITGKDVQVKFDARVSSPNLTKFADTITKS